MTNYMSQGTKAVIKPPILTIVGLPEAAKLAAGLFPKPAFIQAEDSKLFSAQNEEKQPHFNHITAKTAQG